MLDSLVTEIIIALIMTAGSKVASVVWKAARKSFRADNRERSSKNHASKKHIRAQFYVSAFVGVACLLFIGASSGIVKPLFGVICFFSFFLVWSAFEVAIERISNDVNNDINYNSENKSD